MQYKFIHESYIQKEGPFDHSVRLSSLIKCSDEMHRILEEMDVGNFTTEKEDVRFPKLRRTPGVETPGRVEPLPYDSTKAGNAYLTIAYIDVLGYSFENRLRLKSTSTGYFQYGRAWVCTTHDFTPEDICAFTLYTRFFTDLDPYKFTDFEFISLDRNEVRNADIKDYIENSNLAQLCKDKENAVDSSTQKVPQVHCVRPVPVDGKIVKAPPPLDSWKKSTPRKRRRNYVNPMEYTTIPDDTPTEIEYDPADIW